MKIYVWNATLLFGIIGLIFVIMSMAGHSHSNKSMYWGEVKGLEGTVVRLYLEDVLFIYANGVESPGNYVHEDTLVNGKAILAMTVLAFIFTLVYLAFTLLRYRESSERLQKLCIILCIPPALFSFLAMVLFVSSFKSSLKLNEAADHFSPQFGWAGVLMNFCISILHVLFHIKWPKTDDQNEHRSVQTIA